MLLTCDVQPVTSVTAPDVEDSPATCHETEADKVDGNSHDLNHIKNTLHMLLSAHAFHAFHTWTNYIINLRRALSPLSKRCKYIYGVFHLNF